MTKTIFMTALTAFLLAGCDLVSNQSTAEADTTDTTIQAAKADKTLFSLLDVNTASDTQLSKVPGLTPEMRRSIEDMRPFLDMAEFDDELDLLLMSSKDRQALYKYLFMILDVNNSPAEDFLFVPGVSKKLAYVIESGRPYQDLDALKQTLEGSYKGESADDLIKYFKVTKPKPRR